MGKVREGGGARKAVSLHAFAKAKRAPFDSRTKVKKRARALEQTRRLNARKQKILRQMGATRSAFDADDGVRREEGGGEPRRPFVIAKKEVSPRAAEVGGRGARESRGGAGGRGGGGSGRRRNQAKATMEPTRGTSRKEEAGEDQANQRARDRALAERKRKKSNIVYKRTGRGQPVMRHRIEDLLNKI